MVPIWPTHKELIRWPGCKHCICFREESFVGWRKKHGVKKLNVILWHDFWYFLRAQELSDGFSRGVLLKPPTFSLLLWTLAFKLSVCVCLCVNKSDFPQLSAAACVFTRKEQLASHQAYTLTSIMACSLCQDTVKICNYCNQSIPLILSFWTLPDQKWRWLILSLAYHRILAKSTASIST